MKSDNITRVKPCSLWRNNNKDFLKAIDNKWYRHIVELDNLISYYTTIFYRENGMKTLFLPLVTNSISSPMGKGSDSLPVKISLFDVDTYLADSMQFMLEYGCRFFPEGCYYLMPSFRGEQADERHLCQFYHSEAEILGGLEDVMCLVEKYIKYLSKNILNDYEFGIRECAGTTEHIKRIAESEEHFPRVTYKEALNLLKNYQECYNAHEDGEVTITHLGEQKLIEIFGGTVWLTHMKATMVPFYQATCKNDMDVTETADLLMGIGETVGCGARHSNADQVMNALRMHEVSPNEYMWYLDMKRTYPMQTAGFGMGIERFLLWVLNHTDIRDCQLIPRFNGVKSII